jgi:hypothetical protein
VHAGEVPVAEPLDRVAADDRRDQHAQAMAGKPYRAPVPLHLTRVEELPAVICRACGFPDRGADHSRLRTSA